MLHIEKLQTGKKETFNNSFVFLVLDLYSQEPVETGRVDDGRGSFLGSCDRL